MKAERKLKDVLEEFSEDRLAAPMGKPVGIERDERAADDHEQPEADPGRHERQQMRPG
jgi:hypothetical protein